MNTSHSQKHKPETMTLIYVKDEKRTIKSLCAMIERASNLDVFRLEDVVLDGTNEDITNLSKCLRGHHYLEEFDLTNITLTDSSLNLDAVVSVLLLTVPDLMHVKLEKVPVTASALAKVQYCSSLKTLRVPNSDLTDEDAIELAKALAQSPSIRFIDISGNDFSDLGCIAFVTALEKNTSIQTVRLQGNGKISDEHHTLLATTLRDRAGGKAHAA
jgi:Ran GTPase-activating protein (RanGAP) involved in mRNA processing and transport